MAITQNKESMNQSLTNKFERLHKEEKKKRQEAEGELTIIKGIGNNSPEMKALQSRVKVLDNSLSIALDINDKHQRELKEVKHDNKKLAQQITDLKKEAKDMLLYP